MEKIPGTKTNIDTRYREHLENLIEKHYSLTKFRNPREKVLEIRKFFDSHLQ